MRILLFFLFTILIYLEGSSQEKQDTFFLKTGLGYFADIEQALNPGFGDVPPNIQINPDVEGEIQRGFTLWVDFGYKLPSTGFITSVSVALANTTYEYNDGLGIYWDFNQQGRYLLIDLAFGRNLAISRHEFVPYIGISYRHFFSSFADYDVGINQNGTPAPFFPTIIEAEFKDLGMSFKLDYNYLINHNLSFGIRAATNLVFVIGFESIIVSPFISLRF